MNNPVRCEYVTGIAGSGKTTLMRHRVEEDISYGILCSTTGISAVNLGTVTINSLLGYFDTNSMRDAYTLGRLRRALSKIGGRNIIVDEVSMMDAEQLDILYTAVQETNMLADSDDLGIVVTGDMAQLPPVKAQWVFKAGYWQEFADHKTKLDKCWRQSDGSFLDALNLARIGNGWECVSKLRSLIEFSARPQQDFDGTTIYSRNLSVDVHNAQAYAQLPGEEHFYATLRRGQQRSEWKLIPSTLPMRTRAYVMCLANKYDSDGGSGKIVRYVNGDCGHVSSLGDKDVTVELARTGQPVKVEYIERTVLQKNEPSEDEKNALRDAEFSPYQDERGRWVMGFISYLPLRLAYATTIHKSQGLTLDRCQIDVRDSFFGSPAMAYVALSRVRTADGLCIVGSPETLATRIKANPEALKWS